MRSKTVEKLLNNTPTEIANFTDLYADLLVRIDEILTEKKITQKSLAEKMGKQPSEISKWLSGDHNFTLRSLARLSAELGEPLLMVPPRKTNGQPKISTSTHTVKKRLEKVNEPH